jgi:Rod binding domain-containing protein
MTDAGGMISTPKVEAGPAPIDASASRADQVRSALSGSGGIRTRSFVESLRAAEAIEDPEERAHAEARAVAEEFVAISLVEPLLAQARESGNAWGPFKPGPHEKQFGAMLDSEYAARIVRSSNYGLVDRLARDLRRTLPDVGALGVDTRA